MDEWEVIEVKKAKGAHKQHVYDIKVKDNHNFFANKILSSNCHHVSASTLFKIAMKCDNAILIGLSATPYRAYKPETMKIIAALGEIVYSISCRKLIEEGYLVDAEVRIVDLKQDSKIEYWDTYTDIVDKYITNNKDRNNKIVEVALNDK